MHARAPVIGIVGWKNAGKTTLAARLVEELTGRGLRISTIKHAHHALRLDDEGTDSARHRAAGASQVAVVSSRRWALMTEGPEPDFEDIVAMLDPCDLIVVEGYKSQPIKKIETRRDQSESRGHGISESDPNVIAIAADHDIEGAAIPVFRLDDVSAIADFILVSMEVSIPEGDQ
ncbi:MAG: molybdopterin-guanine dinucleotide biosynthesis protein B [Alphaproteobacteria bacterium]|nr:molybdopterin-guanine dinucleotide biosynthesis protein B [Alphaproteobacteria bacterium]